MYDIIKLNRIILNLCIIVKNFAPLLYKQIELPEKGHLINIYLEI